LWKQKQTGKEYIIMLLRYRWLNNEFCGHQVFSGNAQVQLQLLLAINEWYELLARKIVSKTIATYFYANQKVLQPCSEFFHVWQNSKGPKESNTQALPPGGKHNSLEADELCQWLYWF
jgi:hypothetical protein